MQTILMHKSFSCKHFLLTIEGRKEGLHAKVKFFLLTLVDLTFDHLIIIGIFVGISEFVNVQL